MANEKLVISILLLSIDRYDHLKRTLVHNLENIGTDYELLVCDNGSTDPRVIELLESYKPTYFRKNEINEGCGKSFNQLYLRSIGSHIALMSNDILWPKDWGKEMVEWSSKVPDCGLVGIIFRDSGNPPLTIQHNYRAHWLIPEMNRIFGPTFFKRQMVERIGLFAEDFGPYGLEDSDLNERVILAGLNSFYLPGLRAEHLIEDSGQDTAYRKAKDKSLSENSNVFGRKVQERLISKDPREPLPDARGPLLRE